jgi:hypothetical protein
MTCFNHAYKGLTAWLNYFFMQEWSPADLLCWSNRAFRRGLAMTLVRIESDSFAYLSPPPSEDASRWRCVSSDCILDGGYHGSVGVTRDIGARRNTLAMC